MNSISLLIRFCSANVVVASCLSSIQTQYAITRQHAEDNGTNVKRIVYVECECDDIPFLRFVSWRN